MMCERVMGAFKKSGHVLGRQKNILKADVSLDRQAGQRQHSRSRLDICCLTKDLYPLEVTTD